MTRRTFHSARFAIERDETSEALYEAECVSGEANGCGAESGPQHGPGPVGEWMRQHARETGHRRYLRIFSDYVVMRSQGELPCPGTWRR